MPVHAGAAERVVLDVEVGVARGRHGAGDAGALVVRVHVTGSDELVRGLPDRVVDRVAVRDARAAGQEDADELVAPADAADLLRGLVRVLCRDRDQPAQPRLLLEVRLERPVVVGGRELRGEHRVGQDAERAGDVVGRRDADRDVVRVEHLRAHLVEVDRVEARVVALGVERVLAHPAGRVVPGIAGQREPVVPGVQQQLARRRIGVVDEVERRVRADVDVAVDEHGRLPRADGDCSRRRLPLSASIAPAARLRKRRFAATVMKKFDYSPSQPEQTREAGALLGRGREPRGEEDRAAGRGVGARVGGGLGERLVHG